MLTHALGKKPSNRETISQDTMEQLEAGNNLNVPVDNEVDSSDMESVDEQEEGSLLSLPVAESHERRSTFTFSLQEDENVVVETTSQSMDFTREPTPESETREESISSVADSAESPNAPTRDPEIEALGDVAFRKT